MVIWYGWYPFFWLVNDELQEWIMKQLPTNGPWGGNASYRISCCVLPLFAPLIALAGKALRKCSTCFRMRSIVKTFGEQVKFLGPKQWRGFQ